MEGHIERALSSGRQSAHSDSLERPDSYAHLDTRERADSYGHFDTRERSDARERSDPHELSDPREHSVQRPHSDHREQSRRHGHSDRHGHADRHEHSNRHESSGRREPSGHRESSAVRGAYHQHHETITAALYTELELDVAHLRLGSGGYQSDNSGKQLCVLLRRRAPDLQSYSRRTNPGGFRPFSAYNSYHRCPQVPACRNRRIQPET